VREFSGTNGPGPQILSSQQVSRNDRRLIGKKKDRLLVHQVKWINGRQKCSKSEVMEVKALPEKEEKLKNDREFWGESSFAISFSEQRK